MDYLSATRIVNSSKCAACGGQLAYRIGKDGEYEILCPHNSSEHQGVIPQPTNREVWAESFRRQAEITAKATRNACRVWPILGVTECENCISHDKCWPEAEIMKGKKGE